MVCLGQIRDQNIFFFKSETINIVILLHSFAFVENLSLPKLVKGFKQAAENANLRFLVLKSAPN